MVSVNHIAISVSEFERYSRLFVSLGFNVLRESGEYPNRQLWFKEGIQLKEDMTIEDKNVIDHIALEVDHEDNVVKLALENGCYRLRKNDNWIALPNGIAIVYTK